MYSLTLTHSSLVFSHAPILTLLHTSHLTVIPVYSLTLTHTHPHSTSHTQVIASLSLCTLSPMTCATTHSPPQLISLIPASTHTHDFCYHTHSLTHVYSHTVSPHTCHHCVLTVLPHSLTVTTHTHHSLPWCPPTTKSSHPCHPCVFTPLLTSRLLSVNTLPWCRTTTNCAHTVLSHTTTPTNPCAPSHFISPHSHPLFNSNHSHTLSHLSPTLSPHHASIASSSPHHHFLPPTTTHRFLSSHTTRLTPLLHSQPSQSPPKSISSRTNTHNENSRTPLYTQPHQTNSIKKMG